MKIAAWNVNSVKARLAHLLAFLREAAPDIVLLQETKCEDAAFPALEIEELGYNLALHGQKTYNGVAILSKFPLEDVTRGLPPLTGSGDAEDVQARYIEAVVSLPGAALRVASVYVPNGQDPESDKFAYKLRFLTRLRAHAASLLQYEEMLIIGGDYNIAPFDVDVHNPRAWADTVLCHPDVRAHFRAMLNGGFYDAYRLQNPCGDGIGAAPISAGYTWWDYRAGALERDDGLRIDHLLLSPQAADRLASCRVAKEFRALEKASDHAPVVGDFAA